MLIVVLLLTGLVALYFGAEWLVGGPAAFVLRGWPDDDAQEGPLVLQVVQPCGLLHGHTPKNSRSRRPSAEALRAFHHQEYEQPRGHRDDHLQG